ncbi:hypothetical protein H6F68_25340, partial [Trichocoleus sp. FACHB-262]|nr:hypothetical protein [Trichocoleus sp. FACHB-262]
MTHARRFDELIAERTETLDTIRAIIERMRYLISLIPAQIQLEQQDSNTSSDSQHYPRAEILEAENHVLRRTVKGLEINAQAITAASQEEIARSRQLQTTNYKLQTTNYKLQTTNYKLQTTNYKLQTTNYKLQ